MASYSATPSTIATTLSLILVLFVSFNLNKCYGARALPHEAEATTMEFIRSSCSRTTYPSLCLSSLSRYASIIRTSPTELARTALSLSLDRARSTSAEMKAISMGGMARGAKGAMSDCMENMGDSVYELQKSMEMMGELKGRDVGFQINSIQTWVSAAITDYDTCTDGFSESAASSNVGSSVKSRMLKVTQTTSNALALVNLLVYSSNSSSP